MTTDIRIVATRLYFLPIETRVPLKFGTETLRSVTCARACVTVEGRDGRRAEGWGETPLSVQWVWPSPLPYAVRHARLKDFCERLARELPETRLAGHAFEIGCEFQGHRLDKLLKDFNAGAAEPMPLLAALVCLSVFDIALHDAYGQLHGRGVYETLNGEWMNSHLGHYLESSEFNFDGKFPADFLVANPQRQLLAWHLVGGLDPLDASELTGSEPRDGYPVLLRDWIRRDGLQCLKIKLRGNDSAWDYDRVVRVGKIAREEGVRWLTADFNCTVTDPVYVTDILDRLQRDERAIFDALLYVAQPFPYDLEKSCGGAANSAGRAWPSRPAKHRPARCSAPAGHGRTGCS
jgi:L-alanine-DL-glutamate epimerase-like enolase superfamily enzyme